MITNVPGLHDEWNGHMNDNDNKELLVPPHTGCKIGYTNRE